MNWFQEARSHVSSAQDTGSGPSAPATPPRRWPGLLGVLCLLLAACLPVVAQDATSEDGDDPDADTGYRFLLRDVTTTVNNKGLKTTRMHSRIEIQKQHAVDVIGDVSIPYNAFRSEARVVKAFTLTADGRTVSLKKESVRDLTPDEVSSYQMYTDVHQITFSMPALGKGAIMDYEVEIAEKKPVMTGEFWMSEFLDSSVLVCTSRVSIVFPAKCDARIVATNLSAQTLATDVTNRGMRTLTWVMTNVPALEYEPGMPPYSVVRPQVHLTSVKSWQQVEDWYVALTKKHLQSNPEIQAQARNLVGGLTNQIDQIQALYRYASRDVRYVGVELGRSAYEPHSPIETLQNKYGDCKDKASLLVALLNAAGIPAHMAIVRPNYDGPVDQNLPGPAQFNHAIVYVPREKGDLWIDATEPYGNVLEHGYHLDDIDAMVVGLPGKTFVHIPASDETHSVHRLIFDLDVHYGGLCTVREIQEYTGRAATPERNRRSRFDDDKVRKQLEHNFTSGNGYGRLIDYSFTNPTNDCEPMRVVTEYDSDTFLTATKSGFSIRFDASELREWVDIPRPDPASVRKHKRVFPWVSRTAHTEEIVCRLHLPEGYELARMPSETSKNLPHGKAELVFDKQSEIPCLTLRVIGRPARLEPQDLAGAAQQVDQALARIRASLDIEESVNEQVREHHFAKAEADIVAAARRNTNSADAMVRLGSYYKSVGRVYQSRIAFEKAAALAPRDPRGYEMLADTWSGWWGVPGEGIDHQAMMAVYDRALTNVPVRAWSLNKKAGICLLNDLGQDDSTNHLDEAEGYFQALIKEDAQSYPGLLGLGHVNRLRCRYDEAEEFYRKAARVKPNESEPRAGIWISMAFAGRDEEAWNAMSAYYGPGEQMMAEVVRVASLLTIARKYEAGARLYERMVEAAARPEVLQKMIRLLRKAEKTRRDSYADFFDNSTPENLAQTLSVASIMGDTDKVFRCLSPVVNRDEVARQLKAQSSLLRKFSAQIGTNYLADIVLSAFSISKRTLDNGDVEVKLDSSKSIASALSAMDGVSTFQMQPVSNRWQAITLDNTELDCATFGRLAVEALDSGDTARAVVWQTRLADLACPPRQKQGRTASPLVLDLQQIAFTNDVLRVKAWAGMGLSGSHVRADAIRAAACLEDVMAAYPDDAWIKLALAKIHHQLANVRKSSSILHSINITNLAAPDQLQSLAWMLLSMEKIDTAEKVMGRLREVAPDDEQLLVLQAQVLTCRDKFADATAALARFRDRTKLDSRATIPIENMIVSRSGSQSGLRDFIERWRDPEKPIVKMRPTLSFTCLNLGLPAEASEQIATMIVEGGLNADALIGYAQVALFCNDTNEARHLVTLATRLNEISESDRLKSLALVHLSLCDYPEAARAYHEDGTRFFSHYSGYDLCLSAIASRLAGDEATAAESLKLAATMQGDSDWPRLAIQFVNGEISEDEFRRAPDRTTSLPYMHASRECEVNCILGLLRESKRDIPGAIAAYKASLDTKSATDLEYLMARLALQRLQGVRP